MSPCLENKITKKGLVEWIKVYVLSLYPSTAKKNPKKPVIIGL
jgi:hypothetical protein